VSAQVFEKSSVPPLDGSTDFSLYRWNEIRNFALLPEFHAGMAEDDEGRLDFLVGARLMGYELEDWDPERRLLELTDPAFAAAERARRLKAGYFEQLVPQQLVISDTLDLPRDEHVIETERRVSKTTSIFLKILGRLARRPGRQATFSAQNGVAGSRRLREWAQRLDAVNPPDDQDLPPWLRGRGRKSAAASRQVALFGEELAPADLAPEANRRGFRVMRGEVGKGIYFENGSQLLVLKPEADAYRGEGADDSWLDELQEVDPDEGDDLLAGILPLQDTKIGSSTIASGTAGEERRGPMWSMLDRLRRKDPTMGGLDYAAPEDTPWEMVEDEESAMRLLAQVHPGIGTLTTIEKMRRNYRALPKPQWAREYLSMWPETFGTVIVDAGQWTAAALASKPNRPERVAFGVDIRPGGSVAAIVAAWRSAKGVAYLEVVEHRAGTKWLPERMQELTRRYRGSTIAFDDIAEGKATFTESERLTPKPRLRMQTYRETAAGCVQFLRDLERGTLRHADQVGLNASVAVAGRRETRTDQGVWLWTPAEQGADITCLVAATRALRNWDQHFARSTGTNRSVMGA
jgi:hypothetical protein